MCRNPQLVAEINAHEAVLSSFDDELSRKKTHTHTHTRATIEGVSVRTWQRPYLEKKSEILSYAGTS